MKPDQHFDKSGKSPFMDMQLVAKYADEGAAATDIAINPNVTQNLGLRLAKVERGVLAAPVTAVGSVQWNEREIAVVQARSAGFVERVYGRAAGDVVGKGAPLADLLIPEWAGAQSEFLALRRTGDAALTQAARERLKLLGMPDELIARVEASGQAHPVVTITTPIAGVIQSMDVRVGMSLTAGMSLATINGIDPVWLEAAVPEAQSGGIAAGNPVNVTLAASSGERFTGKVLAVLPQTNQDSHTVRVRVELSNHDMRLRPGMFAQMDLDAGDNAPTLLAPSEAVIRTGARNLVLLALDGGRFQPVEVKLGQEASGKIAVLEGLREGQSIVASGQFLIDSEASLQGVLARLPTQTVAASDTALNEADGTVKSISGDQITLAHEPVKSLGWPAMTMPFQLARAELAAGLKPGDRAHFSFRESDGGYIIEQINPTRSTP
jgi:Cu(I)/Ag(I) efflux system membrane fusion protein